MSDYRNGIAHENGWKVYPDNGGLKRWEPVEVLVDRIQDRVKDYKKQESELTPILKRSIELLETDYENQEYLEMFKCGVCEFKTLNYLWFDVNGITWLDVKATYEMNKDLYLKLI